MACYKTKTNYVEAFQLKSEMSIQDLPDWFNDRYTIYYTENENEFCINDDYGKGIDAGRLDAVVSDYIVKVNKDDATICVMKERDFENSYELVEY